MIAKLRLIALVLVALLAVAAPTKAAEFHSEAEETAWSGSQLFPIFVSTDSGSVHCSQGAFTAATSSETPADISLTPTFSNCVSTGFIEGPVTIDVNGCQLKLTSSGSAHISGCNEAKGIVYTAPFCTITVTEQEVGPVKYTNGGSGTTRVFVASLSSTSKTLKYHESGGGCKNNGVETTGGSFFGSFTLTGSTTVTKPSTHHSGVWWA